MWRNKIYSILTFPVFALLYVHTAIIVILSTPCAIINQKWCIRKLVHFWAIAAFWILGKKLTVHGVANINRDKKYIILANHTSLFDIMAIMHVFPGVSWFGREHLLKIPIFGYILKMIDYIPMKTSDLKNTKNMIARLIQHSGTMTIAIFPEGTRTLDGKINRFRKGFIHVLRAVDHNIIPITLNGFYSLKPKNRLFINFSSTLEVVVHEPIDNKTLKSKNDLDIISQVKDVIESAYKFN